ncbi:hypothetical protein IV203_028918 [Nitzschia inconspicua]|uniref:DUF4460 domain-containing protein n=1 Tax=Nitzschia inconspicua TaxID=303405 RepID=A0A9K3LPR4_9STRA|nr:hypothetical protein IV203_028918 [Nitzschia inconspicua]
MFQSHSRLCRGNGGRYFCRLVLQNRQQQQQQRLNVARSETSRFCSPVLHTQPYSLLLGLQKADALSHSISLLSCRSDGARRLTSSSSSPSMKNTVNLKRWIQPFVLKCHPDMAEQQGLPKTGQKVNLKAVQSLNSYIDGVQQYLKTNKYPFSSDSVVEIEFVMAFTRGNSSAAVPSTTSSATNSTSATISSGQPITTSRRKVELSVPPPSFTAQQTIRHVRQQIVKLLKIASLTVPNSLAAAIEDDKYDATVPQDHLLHDQQRQRPLTPWEASRQRFWQRVEWKKFDAAYQAALQDAQAHLLTRNKIRNTPVLRQRLLAKILSNISFSEHVIPLERLVAYRRLLRLLDENFDALHLEDFGTFWEDQMTLVVTEARPYNTSSSAMRKRRQRHLETGYSFTIHHNNLVTVSIPIDFTDSELMQELARNIIDFVEWTTSASDDNDILMGNNQEGIFQ